jgi:hypothetical protein
MIYVDLQFGNYLVRKRPFCIYFFLKYTYNMWGELHLEIMNEPSVFW